MISEWFTTKPQRYCSNQCKTVLDKIFGIQKKKSDACDSNKKRNICAHQLTASYFVGLDCCLNGLLKISPSSQCLSSVNSWVWPVWSVRVVFPISGVCVCLANLYMLVGHRSLQNPDGLAWNQIIIVIAFFFVCRTKMAGILIYFLNREASHVLVASPLLTVFVD